MTATVYEIIPAERTWSAYAELVSQALMDGVEHHGRPNIDERAARVPLGELLARLDEPARQVVLDAVAIACQVTR